MKGKRTKLEELVDELAEEGLPRHMRVAYALYDLARDMVRAANEARDTEAVDQGELERLARRALAVVAAAQAENDAKARELLSHPHRMKGVACP
ncbi:MULTISPECIES: hypothetical protein [Thermus]|uniref:Uncharacterized protein n=4 Tax=Thermus TaxID=270 RepID=A0A0N0IR07_THESC|nr:MULTISPECIES: hypothetical protein [Thermus]APD10180.1 hypothetical protein A0O31_02126 [Thermus brockianus]KHG65805.1 hypothetical protein QT17_04445 [Thermus sp. 2.9]KPD32275.1 hypothetical protein AN926_04780 [Thermus scotoductus]QWK21743.1 MAG: hypothetical protein KNN15_12150 [Thermus antranikianii]RTG92052.1 hypothetical protein CSW51_11800 [Thermus scotoductus]